MALRISKTSLLGGGGMLLLSLRQERKETSSLCNKTLRKIEMSSPVELHIPSYHVKCKSLPELHQSSSYEDG